MEVAAQDIAAWRQVVCGPLSTGSNKSSQVILLLRQISPSHW